MTHRKKVLILLGLSIVGLIVGYVLSTPENFGICKPDQKYSCIYWLSDNIGQPVGMLSIAFILTSLILLFTPERAFNAWKKFALVFVPIGALLIYLAPTEGGSSMGLAIGFDKELTTWWVSGLFLGISLIIILVSSLRKKSNKTFGQ